MSTTKPDSTWSPEDLKRHNSMRTRLPCSLPSVFRFMANAVEHARHALDKKVQVYTDHRRMTLISEGADVEWVEIERTGDDEYVISATSEFDFINER